MSLSIGRAQPFALPAFIIGAVTACCASVTASIPPPVLAGQWGGDRANLKVGTDIIRIEFDCGMAMIEGSPKIDLQGAFSATGYFEDFAGGPVNPDQPPERRPTSFRGRLIADILDLTMQVSGEPVPRHLQLKRDHRVKLFRCF